MAAAGGLVWGVPAAGTARDVASGQAGESGPPPAFRPPHSRVFASPAEFDAAVGRAGPVSARLGELCGGAGSPAPVPAAQPLRPRAAVVPHHLVGGHLPAGLFAYLAADPPATLVIIGPDHLNAGPPVATSTAPWITAAGPVEADRALIAELIRAGLAEEAWTVVDQEHSVGALVPLIRYYLPEARVVPLVLRGDLDYRRAVALGQGLGASGGERLFVLASVDFSHYLTPAEAARRDAMTLAALTRGDWDALFAMGPHHLDSAPALAALFAFAGCLDHPGFSVAAHTDASVHLGDPDLSETTSYFLLLVP